MSRSTSNPFRSNRRTHRIGAAMTETILVLPLLVLVLALLFFFGRGWVRLQHASVADRYEAWRQAEHAPGPQAEVTGSSTALNEMFFAGRAESMDYDGHNGFPTDAADAWVRASGSYYPDAERLAQEMVTRLPNGRSVRFTTEHPADSIPVWRPLEGAIRHRYTRFANDWMFVNGIRPPDPGSTPGSAPGNAYPGTPVPGAAASGGGEWVPDGPKVSNMPMIRDMLLTDIDGRLRAEAERGTGLAEVLRTFFLNSPPYVGPEVHEEWEIEP